MSRCSCNVINQIGATTATIGGVEAVVLTLDTPIPTSGTHCIRFYPEFIPATDSFAIFVTFDATGVDVPLYNRIGDYLRVSVFRGTCPVTMPFVFGADPAHGLLVC